MQQAEVNGKSSRLRLEGRVAEDFVMRLRPKYGLVALTYLKWFY